MKNRLYFSFDIRAKLIFTFLFCFVPFLPMSNAKSIILALLFVLFSITQVGFKKTWSNFKLIAPILFLMTILLPLQGRGGKIYLVLWNYPIITEKAITSYIKIVTRFITLSFLFSLLIDTSRGEDIVPALSFFHLPYSFALTLSMTLRFIPLLSSVYREVRDSQRLRLPNPDEKKKNGIHPFSIIPTLTSVLVVSLKSINTTSQALVMRGYGGTKERTSYRNLKNVKKVFPQFVLSVIVPLVLIIIILEV